MNVKTGEVLAMANLPDFDPNDAYKLTSDKYINELKKMLRKSSRKRTSRSKFRMHGIRKAVWTTSAGGDS